MEVNNISTHGIKQFIFENYINGDVRQFDYITDNTINEYIAANDAPIA